MLEQQVSNWQGRSISYYRCLRLLGQGGMGEVWLAEDQRDQRQVALKLLPSVLASEEGQRHLFTREARIAASLNHPHILTVYDFGEVFISDDEVICYLVMPCITGGTLRDRIHATDALLPATEGLMYLRQAAQAIDYVHSRHVLHRDIKPANMLLDGNKLLLTDFGIARALDSDTHRSRTHAGSGTPEYMAPEQIQSKAEAASDRYSLAVIAYQIIVGALPFTATQPFDIMIKQVKEQPPLPHQLNPKLSPPVEKVLLKGLSKQPTERYATCSAFVDALERAVLGQQALSSSETAIGAPGPIHDVADSITTPQIAISLDIPSPSSPEQGPASLTMAPMRLGTSKTSTPPPSPNKPGRRAIVIGGITAAALLAAGGTTAITLFNRKTTPKPPPPPGPHQFIAGKPLMHLTGHKDVVENAVWDPTGRYLATAGADTRVMLWDVGPALQKNITSLETMDQPTSKWKFSTDLGGNYLHWTLDGRNLIVSNTGPGIFTLLNPFSTTSQRKEFSDGKIDPDNFFPPDYICVVPQPHSNIMASNLFSLTPGPITVNFWQPDKPQTPVARLTYKPPTSSSKQSPQIGTIAWSCDGALLAGLISTQEIVIWNAKTKKVQTTITPPPVKVGGTLSLPKASLAWSPTNPHLLAAFNIDAVAIIDVQQSKVLYQLTTNEEGALSPPPKEELDKLPPGYIWYPHVVSISWSPNGRYITSTYARSVRAHVWDLQAKQNKTDKDGRRLQHYLIPPANAASAHSATIFDVNWSPNGRYLATSSYDFSTIIWQVDAK